MATVRTDGYMKPPITIKLYVGEKWVLTHKVTFDDYEKFPKLIEKHGGGIGFFLITIFELIKAGAYL